MDAGSGDGLWDALGWTPDALQLQQLEHLQQLLRHWNQRLNLTRLVEGDDYWIAQVFDSLWPLATLELLGQDRESASDPLAVIDVGTGGGFPGLAVAIALPAARLTLVDSVCRKLEAVGAMARELGLEGRVQLRCERVELTGRDPACRGRHDLALARAVAAAPVVAEYLVPLLAPAGEALLYRGQWSDQDGRELAQALLPLRAQVTRQQQRELPAGRGTRTVLAVRALAPCPRLYPRAVGIPSRTPLGSTTPPDPGSKRQ
jgi:16S rRNA (guanine527-N7)-methyltransferase